MAIKRRGLPLQGAAGAPEGNKNAQRHGLYSQRPPVQVTVPADATLDDMVAFAGAISGSALWIAEELNALEDPRIAPEELDPVVALYAAVAGEGADMQAVLQGRTGLKAAPLGQLSSEQYGQLLRSSRRALELLLSRAASAQQRLEVNGMLVAGKLDNSREVNPIVRYLAGIYRKVYRQLLRHTQYLVWMNAADEQQWGTGPGDVLAMMRVEDDE